MDLSKNQREVVDFLYLNPKARLTSTGISHVLNKSYLPNIVWTPAKLHSILSRLEKRGIVTRNKGIPGKWRLTPKARKAYEKKLESYV